MLGRNSLRPGLERMARLRECVICDRAIEQLVESRIVLRPGGRIMQVEQRIRFFARYRTPLGAATRDQNAVEQRRIFCIDRARKMRARADRRPLTADDGSLQLPDGESGKRSRRLARSSDRTTVSKATALSARPRGATVRMSHAAFSASIKPAGSAATI
jgi:hypothetical protein